MNAPDLAAAALPAAARPVASPFAGVALWWLDLDVPLQPHMLAWLDAGERRRAAAFAFAVLRQRYEAAHAAMRALLAHRTGCDPAEIVYVLGPQDKPALAGGGCGFNLSHAASAGLLAICDDGEVGVDLEGARLLTDAEAMARSQFSAAEYTALEALPRARRSEAFLRTWTRKEACLKAIGSGLQVSPASFDAGPSDSDAPCDTVVDGQPVQVAALALPAGWHGALARLR